MSYQAVEAVMRASSTTGSERLLLMVIATHADAETMTAYLGETTLCKEANMKERNLRYTLAKLKASGELQCIIGGGRGRANLYSITLPKEFEKGAGECPVSDSQAEQEKGQPAAPLTGERGHSGAGFVEEKGGNPSSEKGQCIAEKGQPVAPQPYEPERTIKTIHTPRATKLPDLSPERRQEIAELHAYYCASIETAPLDVVASRTLNRALGEKGLAFCKTVIDGCALDDWPDRKFNNSIATIFKNVEQMERFTKIARVKANAKPSAHRNGNGAGKPRIAEHARATAEYFGLGGKAGNTG